MGYASADAAPTWYRLSEESWAEIRRDYQNGATARELGARWRVSATSIYRHACAGGWTKRRSADALARAGAQAVAAEEQADLEAAQPAPRGRLGRGAIADLLPERVHPDWPEDALQLVDVATVGSGRALRLGRIDEAQALARLAETYGKLAEKEAEKDSPLMLIYLALFSPGFAERAMATHGDPNPASVKLMFWSEMRKREAAGGKDDEGRA
jgi:xanthine/CO dehydrogenase XdhC/CoxF family maturation factor